MKELLLDEAKHGSCVSIRSVLLRQSTHLCVDIFICNYSKLETHGTDHEYCNVMESHSKESSPKEDICPYISDLTMKKH